MAEPNLFQIFVGPLNRLGLAYMVTGSVASIIYGETRLTHDIDLVVEIRSADAERIAEAFPSHTFYCPPVEIIKIEASRPLRGHFNIIHHETGFKGDIYLMGQDELHRWAMSRRQCIHMDQEPIWVAPAEYVILRKLTYYQEGRSEKHLRDIQGILEISGKTLDLPEIERKASLLGLQKLWEDLFNKGPSRPSD
jgi:hypothetical protein